MLAYTVGINNTFRIYARDTKLTNYYVTYITIKLNN